ncbi:MAG: tyrosyl-tRNA synthetase [Parcubacteria group bacterium Gr01-1014_19]|nr:MAG: tyrosyl-tRNA synthetase [Parcubacteria group bacterium Gr01-1014_19]
MDSEKLLARGVDDVIVKEHLAAALNSGKPLRIKFGADPTAPDLHLGHAVILRKLREFQDAGHKVVLIIGDYTAKIGDPSGRSKTRPALSDKEIKVNAKTYFKQVGKILNLRKAEVYYNSKWFKKMKFADVLGLMAKFTTQRILERDDFTKRIKEGSEVYSHEQLYPMMQAYDSVMIKADVEVGGTDQRFNMLTGRDLQRHMGLPEQDVITMPLLVGTDGEKKMSKSLGNYIGITEAPEMMFGKAMSIPDNLIDQYYKLCTDQERTVPDPREAKLRLAELIVTQYHGEKAGIKAKEEFIRVVSEGGKPAEIPTKKLTAGNLQLTDLVVESGFAQSKSEARRLIEQGGVKINDQKKSDPNEIIKISGEVLLQVGKRNFLRLTA